MEANNNQAPKDAGEQKPDCCTRFRTKMRNMGRFIYNSDTKEILGRSGLSWIKILAFYFGFYAVLAGFFAICMVVFIKTLDPVAPTMQKMYSLMKDNPGMNFEPFPDTSTTLISFVYGNGSSYSDYVKNIQDVIDDYKNRSLNSNLKDCSTGAGATADVACRFDLTTLGTNCTAENHYGYKEGKPCVLLRINKVYLWEPNNVTFDSLDCTPNSNCDNLNKFKALPASVRSDVMPGYIAVSCEGENDGDRDNINKVWFYPGGGFPAYFFPYYNQIGYTPPLVFAQFDVAEGHVSMIWCKIWTRDVIHDKNDLQASIHFELMVDNKSK